MTWLRDIVLPVFISLALHAGLVSFLFLNWEGKSKPKTVVMPRYVEAKLVELKPKTKKIATQTKPKKIDLTAQRQEQEKQKKAAEQKRQAEIKRKQVEEQKKVEAEKNANRN